MAGQKDVSWGPRCHRDPGVQGDELLPACGVSPQWATSSRASTPGRPSRAPRRGCSVAGLCCSSSGRAL